MSKKGTYRIFSDIGDVDISENDIWDFEPDVLRQLLIDHTVSDYERRERYLDRKEELGVQELSAEELKDIYRITANITWATSDYEERGDGFRYGDRIEPSAIIGQNGRIVMPRVLKTTEQQVARSKDKAEVFTPSWMCNAQNNLIDEAWFGRKGVFNREVINEDDTHSWIPTEGKIEFPEGDSTKTWEKYVVDNRMEITCGEAPYLVSRYDTTTGKPIPLKQRVGLLDRKLRIISENCDTTSEWLKMARRAYQHTYGYEWQGDNLLLAREALLYTFIEYFMDKFPSKHPDKRSIIGIARIVSWNLWQMDGIRMVIPDSCDTATERTLFGKEHVDCPACKQGHMLHHKGIRCLIRNWNKKRDSDYDPSKHMWRDPNASPWQKIEFESLFSDNSESDDADETEL